MLVPTLFSLSDTTTLKNLFALVTATFNIFGSSTNSPISLSTVVNIIASSSLP